MLFKRKKKEEIEEVQEEEEETLEEYELQRIFDNHVKKRERKYTYRKYFLFLCIGLGVISFVRVSLNKDTNTNAKEVEAQTFVKTYAKNYYAYPSEEYREYLDQFTFSKDWKVSYGDGVESASIEDVDIYKILIEDEEKNVTKYYCYGTLLSKFKDAESARNQVSFVISVAKNEEQYMVVKPIQNVVAEINHITDKELLELYRFESESANDALDETQKTDIQTTLNLFVKTYNDDVVQARLLCTSENILDELDPNVNLEIKTINTATQDDEVIYISAEVEAKFGGVYKTTRKYYFEIEKERNKIMKMEVY